MALRSTASLLRKAIAYFSTAAVTGDAFDDAVDYVDFSRLSAMVQQAETGWAAADPALQAELTQLLLDLASTLAALEGKLSAALAVRRSAAGQNKATAELLTQMGAALPVLRECAILARTAQLPREQAAQFARCGVLLVGGSSCAVPATWLREFAPALRDPAALPLAVRQPPASTFSVSQVTMQLQAADRLLQLLLECGDDDAMAAFAADVWPPELVTRWLACVLVVVHAGKDADCHHSSLVPLAIVCATLLTHPALAAHQAAVQASLALQSKLVALLPEFLPHLARLLTLLLRDSELAAQLAAQPAEAVAAACDNVAAVVRQAATGMSLGEAIEQELFTRHGTSGAPDRVAFLSTAAAAVLATLRLVHFAAELPLLAARAGQPAGLATAGAQLADTCFTHGSDCMVAAFNQGRKLQQLPERELCAALRQHGVPALLCQLHSTACRLLHCVAAAAPEQLEALPRLHHLQLCASFCAMPFRTTADLALSTAAGAFEARVLQGMAAAQLEAQQVSLQRLNSDVAQRRYLADQPGSAEVFGVAVECRVQAFALCGVPYGSGSAARQALVDSLLQQLERYEHGTRAVLDNSIFVLRHASQHSELAAAVVASGLLGHILRATAEQGAVGRIAPNAVARVQHWASAILLALPTAARTLAEEPHASAAAQQAAQQCMAAAAHLEAVLQNVQPQLPEGLAQLYPAQLELAAQALGSALEAWGDVPEHARQNLLDLSQAVATRGCAYLRCTNVGAVGGPGAGQQQGSSRCSACRAVWYCGTACSHADWRAGHRRVCKALAAVRQADKAAAAAAAEQQQA
ncbi:Zinc finger MYND domain-containing 19 Q7TSV3 isoform B [Chlorella sorokiniana]|nr:Zinc finger MYND domain-containing 19 Q7TSV3 isoform B [Chlorella sorokiniana]|eukprot:PRW57753.1 Zinc finger MYND domain-containing 19 Q7TSV3 isoform B [Chlorella sorokiniana]